MRSEAVISSVVLILAPVGIGAAQAKQVKADCRRVVIEGDVKAGQGFEREFAPGLKFLQQPLPQGSGWIVRVLPVGQGWSGHDFAELATPPYRSVTPLAV